MSETKSTYWEDRAKRLVAERQKAEGSGQKAVNEKQKLEPPKPAPPSAGVNPVPNP